MPVEQPNTFTIPEKSEDESWQEWREAVHKFLEKLAKATAGPVVDEWAQESGATSFLELAPSWGGPWTVESILVVVPAGTTQASLTVGDRVIPLQLTTTVLGPLTLPLAARDKIRVDYAPAAGGVYLEATGRGQVAK